MNVANLELCKELYELSGWGYTPHAYGPMRHDYTDRVYRHWQAKRTGSEWWTCLEDYDLMGDNRDPLDGRRPTGVTHNVLERVPAYDLGYLLRKLIAGQRIVKVDDDYYVANNVQGVTDVNADGKTPEDAAAAFAVHLFKQGILKRGGDE